MMESGKVYFRDNFLSSGETDITDEREWKVGSLDLHSMFGSGITVRDASGREIVKGKFPVFSNTWTISDHMDRELGRLKAKLTFFAKRFVYVSVSGQELYIESPAFSNEYEVKTAEGSTAAHFRKISGMFSAGAFELVNDSNFPMEELIAVVMGVHAIRKRQQSTAAT
ncbi:hypothetical protein ACFQI7_26380 [Paenibacillus allorhizosphaerae]|uniref:LURP-one-related family protein n=1 Tax=Paenibacillus allorhizosphaerae TaxID=2849866 RepID=A0ABM8VMA8_9BACL|nr:hypothetical protein [Paenibacillus allorhizosphaerae]CAG7649577.1 hypothetical protein PAECIP111802_04524 [Paenibacillus allorhizosphaerae]